MQRRTIFPLLALAIGLVLAVGGAELVLRLMGTPTAQPHPLHYRDAAGERVDDPAEAAKRGIIRWLRPPVSPRLRRTFQAGAEFFICYDGATGDWFDERGCVSVRFNSAGIREREEIGFDKPEGQKRILCLGDSFTFGWGIREEDGWVRLLERALRRDDDDIRTVNCGAAGTTVVDEYRAGLEHRFHRFGPDMVLVTLCLNDLLITNAALGMVNPPPNTGLALADWLVTSARDPLELDPAFDWVDFLLGLNADDPLYTTNKQIDHGMLWASGQPQIHLVAMRDWCAERGIPFGVTIWPFLQGLGPDQNYPFQAMHDRVRAFCDSASIPLHDVLPDLRGHDPRSLWVHPTDWHANPRAQQLALPGIEAFARRLASW